jgi:hypothetical protein
MADELTALLGEFLIQLCVECDLSLQLLIEQPSTLLQGPTRGLSTSELSFVLLNNAEVRVPNE